MADIQSNISVNIDTSNALANLKALQGQISAFHQQMAKSGALAASEMSKMQNSLMNGINRSGQFDARIKTIKTTTESFTEALEKNKLSMGQYFKYAGAATKDFGRLFKGEFDTIEKVARERVKDLQTQYIKLGRDANGAMKAISVRPLVLDLNDASTKMQIAAQKQQVLNQLLKQGSTQMLNWGKNTQWAGRQLMVGFTVPLTMLGQIAAKTFMQMEEAVIKFQRVYGDFSTTNQQTKDMTVELTNLAKAYTKYGVAVSDTMSMAADAAAMGKMGAELTAQVQSATELAVLGGIDQKQALETTISLTNAFGIAADELKNKINFLNVVENQTVTSIEDLTVAIPKAAPVIKQLGGDVEDLAFFLTAMKEGGINASEGANALKSGIASIINPTKKASDMLNGFGVNIKGIVDANKGDVKGMIMGVAESLNALDPLKRAQAIEQLFGKFQFARISTLFQNITDVNSQASKVAALAAQGPEASAILAQRELKKIEDSPMFKFKKALEDLKTELVPLGEQFLKMVTPIAEFVKKALEGFNNLSAGTKDFVGNIALWLGGVGPIVIMTVGLIANGIANMIKIFATFKGFLNGVGKGTQDLGSQTSYMTTKQIEAAAVASSLDQIHSKLRQTFTSEASAVANLTTQLERATAAQRQFGWTPTGGVPAKGRKKMANGGMVRGPGGPKDDLVPTDLSNGEAVIDAETVKKNPRIISALFSGKKINIPGYADNNSAQFAHVNENAKSVPAGSLLDALNAAEAEGKVVSKKLKDLLTGIVTDLGKDFRVRAYSGLGFSQSGKINRDMRGDRAVPIKDFVSDFTGRGIDKWKQSVRLGGANFKDQQVQKDLALYDQAILSGIESFKKNTKSTTITSTQFAKIEAEARKTLPEFSELRNALNAAEEGLFEVRANINQSALDRAGIKAERLPSSTGKGLSQKATGRFSTGTYVRTGGNRVSKSSSGPISGILLDTLDSSVDGVKESTDQNSPSRKAKKAGEMIGVGALQGITEVAKKARTQAQQDALMVASRTKSAYSKDATLKNLDIQLKQANMMGANTAAIEQEIAARKKVIAAEVKNAVAIDSATKAANYREFGGSAPLPAGMQGPIGPNDVRKKPSLLSRMGNSKIGQKVVGAGKSFMGGGVASGMGLGVAGMAVGMIPGMEGVGTAISMAGMIPSLLPMLMNPIGLTVAALGALTFGIVALNAVNEENKKKQIALGNATVMSADKMIQVSKDLGTVTATETRRSTQASKIAGISSKDMSQAQSYLESESGKAMLSDIKTQKEGGKTDSEIADAVVNNLANLVSQGAMSKEIASGILTATGQQTGNFSLSSSSAKLQQLTSGNTTDVGASTLKNVKEQYGGLEEKTVTTYNGSYSNLGLIMPELREGAIATSNAYSQIVGQADVLNQKLQSNKITQQEYNVEIEKNKLQQEEAFQTANKIKDTMGDSEWNDTFSKNIKETFGETSEAFKTAEKINKLGDSDFKTRMQINLESGALTPDVVNKFLEMQASDENFDKSYSASVSVHGQTATDDMVVSMLVAGQTQAQIDAVLNITDPEQFKDVQSILNTTNALNIDVTGIDLTDAAAVKELSDEYAKIDEMTKDGPITMSTVIKQDGNFAGLKSQAAWFDKLPASSQRFFLTYYATVQAEMNDTDVQNWLAKKQGMGALIGGAAGNIVGRLAVTDADRQAYATETAKNATDAFTAANPPGDDNNNDSSGGGGTTATDKANAALAILGKKEEGINKAYDKRLKALDAIQAANDRINQQTKDQLDLADALSKGDIGAAARAQQQARETAQANALQKQRDDMDAAKEAQIAALRVNGMSRAGIEGWLGRQEGKENKSTLGSWSYKASGGLITPQYFANGGKPRGTDTIAAMLTPGEFVMKKSAVDKLGAGTMKKINSGELPKSGSVYNYSINVNVKSDADAEQIANVVMTKIQNVKNQGMKGDKA